MLKQFYPYEYADNVFDIDYEALYRRGIRGIIFDIDNTLVHHGDDSTPEVDQLFRSIQAIGLKTLVLSNNTEERVLRFLSNIDSLYVCDADKPEPAGYRKAIELMGIDKRQAVCVGDQVFTDILGANRSGIASILVKFIQLDSETKIGKRRYLEKLILAFYKKSKTYQNRLGGVVKKEIREK